MRSRWIRTAPLAVLVLVACARPQADDVSLRDSFAQRIAGSSFVTNFGRDGAELTFSGPDGVGGTAVWRVRIDSSLVEPNFNDELPYQGRILSEWYANGKVVEYLGNMTAIPAEFLDRGLGQECWAYWVEAERRWDW